MVLCYREHIHGAQSKMMRRKLDNRESLHVT